jgi:hypothetical protein
MSGKFEKGRKIKLDEVQLLITAGGVVVEKPGAEELCVVAGEDSGKKCIEIREKNKIAKVFAYCTIIVTLQFVNIEFVMTGILRQEVDYVAHE